MIRAIAVGPLLLLSAAETIPLVAKKVAYFLTTRVF